MATGWQTFPVEFKGGLISNLSPLQQGMNAVGSATILQNFEPSKDGGYKKILGYSKFDSTVVPGTGKILGVKVINASDVMAVRQDTSTGFSRYWLSNGAGWTSIATAAALGGKLRGVSYNFGNVHKLAFVDGVNAPAIFNDTTNALTFLTSLTDAVGATQVCAYKQTIFFAKGTNLIFSAPYSDTDFSASSGGGIINTGHEITGLIVFRDQLIIFSRNQIQRLVGNTSSDFQLVPVTESLGCIYPDTIQEVGGDIMFMGPDGLRTLSATERIGDFGLEVASSPISKDALAFIRSATEFTSLVVREKAQYRVFSVLNAATTDTGQGLLATKFIDQGGAGFNWATMLGYNVFVCDSRYVPDSLTRELIVFGNNTGFIYRMESGTSRDGALIRSIYQSPFMPITDPQKRKTIYKMALYIDTIGSFNLNLNFLFDIFKVDNYNGEVQPPSITLVNEGVGVVFYGSPTSVYGTSRYGGEIDKVYDTPVIGSGKTFAFRLEDESANSPFTLDTAVFEFKEHDRQ